jgi:hypothetical protein
MSTRTQTTGRPPEVLADAAGPIPAFGPAAVDEHGRIALTDEEWEARRAAAVRALDAIAAITDETDTDETWREVFRGIDAGRPHRKLFEGMY